MAVSEKKELVRFVILTTARSGSNLLVSMLHSHAHALCHAEAFHRRHIYALPPLNDTPLADRNRDRLAFAVRLFALGEQTPGCTAVGFKLFYYHAPTLLYRLIRQADVRFIVLHRADDLAQYASRQIAVKTDNWEQTKRSAGQSGRTDQTAKIRYRFFDHLTHAMFNALCYKTTLGLLRRFRANHTVVEYEQLVESMDEQQRRITDFLALAPMDLRPATFRQNPPNPLDRFDNPVAAKRGAEVVNRLTAWMRIR